MEKQTLSLIVVAAKDIKLPDYGWWERMECATANCDSRNTSMISMNGEVRRTGGSERYPENNE
jgi:hypothetical protein